MTIGIYCIQFNQHPQWYPTYVGQSNNIEHRIRQHKINLKNKSHHNYLLQEIYNQYGADSLEYYIVESCTIEELTTKEIQYALDFGYPEKELCFNIAEPGGFCLYHTDVTKKRISEAQQGEQGNNAILNDLEARFILTSLSYEKRDYTYEDLASFFKVSAKTVENIKLRSRWKHIDILSDDEYLKYKAIFNIQPSPRQPSGIHKKFSNEEIQDIRKRHQEGENQISIAKDYCVSRKAIYRIINRYTYAHVQ